MPLSGFIKWFLLLIIGVAWASGVYAQRIDSLNKVLAGQEQDSSRARTLLNLGIAYRTTGDDSLARLNFERAVKLAQKTNAYKIEGDARLFLVRTELEYLTDIKGITANLDAVDKLAELHKDKRLKAWAIYRRGQYYIFNYPDQSKVVSTFNEAMKIAKEIDDETLEAKLLNDLGYRANSAGLFAESIDYWLQGMKIQERLKDSTALISTIQNIALSYRELGKLDVGKKYFDRAEALADALHDKRAKGVILGNKSEIFFAERDYPKALQLAKEAASILNSIGAYGWLLAIYCDIANCYLEMGDIDKALEFGLKSENLYKETNNSDEQINLNSQLVLCKVYFSKRQFQKVVSLAHEGLKWSLENDPVLLRETAEFRGQLARAYEALGRPTEALKYFKEFKVDSDSLYSREKLQNAMLSGMEYENEKSQNQANSRIVALEAEKLRLGRNGLIGLSLVTLVGLFYFVWANRKLRFQNIEISNKFHEIESALLRGQNLERKRVANELHDNLSARLAAIRWRLEAVRPTFESEMESKIFHSSIKALEEAYAEVRLISHNLLPGEFEKKGIVATFNQLLGQLNSLERTSFKLDISESVSEVSTKVGYELYNLLLELCNNILKHSAAENASIAIRRNENIVQLEVIDDGLGIRNEHQSGTGMGLINIRERVKALSGKVKFENIDGLRVFVEVPVA